MHKLFKDIPGQNQAKEILSNFLSTGKTPHAFLFTGLNGVGKEFTAFRFTEALNFSIAGHIDEKVSNQIKQLNEPFIKYIIPLPRGKNETDTSGPTEKLSNDELETLTEEIKNKIENPFYKISIPRANNIKISSIRDIKKFLSLQYEESFYRAVIISDAHLMNEEAQNALLKSLEEPPDKVVFILITPQPARLRETIRSRCWRINFSPLSEMDLVDVLIKYFKADKKLSQAVAPFSDGSLYTAINLIESDFYNLREKTISILRYSFGRKFNSAFDQLNSVLGEQSAVNIPLVIKMINTWINDLIKHKYHLKKIFFKEHEETLEKFNAKFPDVELNNTAAKLEYLSSLLKNNVNPNLIAANIIFELSSVINTNPAKSA